MTVRPLLTTFSGLNHQQEGVQATDLLDRLLKDPLPGGKLSQPAFRTGIYRTSHTSGRDHQPTAFGSVAVESDKGEMSFDDAVAALRTAGLAAIVYTSWSHSPSCHRWRVVCPLRSPIPADAKGNSRHYHRMVEQLNGVFKGVLQHNESKWPKRLWFFARVPVLDPGRKDAKGNAMAAQPLRVSPDFQVRAVEGAFLDDLYALDDPRLPAPIEMEYEADDGDVDRGDRPTAAALADEWTAFRASESSMDQARHALTHIASAIAGGAPKLDNDTRRQTYSRASRLGLSAFGRAIAEAHGTGTTGGDEVEQFEYEMSRGDHGGWTDLHPEGIFAVARRLGWDGAPISLSGLEAFAPAEPVVAVGAVSVAVTGGHRERIATATDEAGLRVAAAYIKGDTGLDDFARSALVTALSAAFKRIDMPVSIATVRALVKPERVKIDGEIQHEWFKDWIWITSIDRFARGAELVTTRSFNAMFNRDMPRNAEGGLMMTAADWALDHAGMQHVRAQAYLPFCGPGPVELNGDWYLNTYDHSKVPVSAEVVDQVMVETMRDHLKRLCGNREWVWRALEWWLAHQVQNPGVKVRWSPLIKGVQGDGKTVLKQMLMLAMGIDNVGEVGNAEIASGFNDWAINVAVLAVEELKVAGTNRHLIVNALKPLISNDTLSVHRKGLAAYKTINTTNVLAFTNYSDAIPIDGDGDRRWFVIVTPFSHRSQLPGAGMGKPYFDRLYDETVNPNPDQVRSWLMSVDLNAGGFSRHTMPEGHDQAAMVDASRTDIAKIVLEIIEGDEVWPGVSRDACTAIGIRSALRDRLVEEFGIDEVKLVMPWDQDWARVMKSIGFERKRMRRNGSNPVTVWVRTGRVDQSLLDGKDPFDG